MSNALQSSKGGKAAASTAAPEKAPERANAEKSEKKKKEKVEKVVYDGAPIETPETPENFDPKKHKSLNKKNFANEHTYMRWQANQLEAKVKRLRKDADEMEKLGGGAGAAKSKKMLKLYQQMQALAENSGDEIDLEALLGADVAAALTAEDDS